MIMNKKGKSTIGIILIIALLAGAGVGGYFLYVWISERQTITPEPPPVLLDELTTVYNGQQVHTTKCTIYVRDKLDPSQSVIAGIAVYIYQYGTTKEAITKGDAVLLDSMTTDSNGKATSTREFTSGTLLTCVVGLATSTNKSMIKDFVMQGQDSSTKPSDINCGIFYYMPMAEESEVTITWTDSTGTALGKTWNYTADSDGILEAKIKVVLANSGKSIRGMWSQHYKDLSILMAVKLTNQNSSASAAANILSPYNNKGTPANNLVFIFTIADIIYEVDSTGQVEGSNEAYRFYSVKIDFTGCSLSANNRTEFYLGGWLLCEYDINQPVDAGLPSGNAVNWFQKAFPILSIVT